MFSARWQGHVATIVDDPGEEVWGVIWELDLKDLSNLDEYVWQCESSHGIRLDKDIFRRVSCSE